MTVVSKLSKSPSTTVDNRQRRMEVGTTALRGGLYKCTGGECEGGSTGPSRLDYTLVLASVMVVLCCVHVRGRSLVSTDSMVQHCVWHASCI
jgi:hypothetical protein